MALDLVNIEPQKISKDMSSYTNLVYGPPKIGKTTFVHDLYGDDALIIATEKGYKALAGAYIADCGSWSDFMKIVAQLRKKEVKDKYKVIVIDTLDLLYEYAEKYTLNKLNINSLSDIGYGVAYHDLSKTLFNGLNMLEKEGYTVAFISHSITKPEKIPQGEGKDDLEIEKHIPTAPKRALSIATKMVDNILFCSMTQDEETGDQKRVIHTRETLQWQAGARFKNMKETFPLSAKEYTKEMKKAVDSYGKKHLKEDKEEANVTSENLNFDELMTEAKELGVEFHKEKRMDEVSEVVEETFGKGVKLTDAKESQVELLSIAVEKLKEIK